MESISTPQVINMPFCADGDKNTIPSAATGTQRASLEEGFPEITSKPISEGGIPPEREDFNGAMNLNSQFYFAFQNGWWPTFDADVSTAIGGYPLGAVLWWFPTTGNYAHMAVPLKSLVANNTYNFNTNSSYVGVYWQPLYKDPNALPIGTVFMHQSSNAADVPGALPLFTGETISSANTLYPDFYNWVLSHTDLQISAADYESAITTYGECPKYVIDDTNKTIRLPKLVNYIKMANTDDGITQSAAGLPDHNHTLTEYDYSGSGHTSFLSKESGANAYTLTTSNASASNSIYGNSNTVTPAHTTLFPWVCAYNAAVPASTAQAAEFQQALSSKVDVADMEEVQCVVETYHSGTSWYRVWSDGFCEQGGRIVGGSQTVMLLKEYANTDYSINITQISTGSTSASYFGTGKITSLNTDSFVYVSAQTENPDFSWCARGYIA